jgi:hypothetical protein
MEVCFGGNDSCVVTSMKLYSTCMVWFEWDDAKAKTNEGKHGVRFDEAMLVFSDTYAWSSRTELKAENFAGKLLV